MLGPDIFSQDFNIVLLGSLNAEIFHPEWFRRHELVGAEVAAEAVIKVVSPQVTEVDIGQFRLQCSDSRLILATDRASHAEALFDLGRGILSMLPHTPLKAAGINHEVHFRVETEERWHQIGNILAPKEEIWKGVCESPGMLRLSIQSPRSDWDFPLVENFTVEPYPKTNGKHTSIIVRANTHFAFPLQDADKGRAPSELASRFLDDIWEGASKKGIEIAGSLMNSLSPV